MILKFILLTFLFLNLYAIELTKPLMMDMSRTYGYITTQNLVLERLKKKYPSKSYDFNKAQVEFNLKFKPSIDNLKKTFGEKEWEKFEGILENKLIDEANKINLNSSYKNAFANEVLLRVKGNIESPVIETLLMFHPKYQKNPILEFTDGFKKRLSSKDNPKAKDVDFHIDIPQSWKVKEGKRPNTLWLSTYQNGYLNEDNSQVSLSVIVKSLPENIETITKQEARDFCNEVLNNTPIKECLKTTLENLPAIYARNTITVERLRIKMTIEAANYYIFYNDRIIFLQAMVGNINNTLTEKQLNNKFEKFLPLFDQIVNSLVIKDLYTEISDTETNYYIYKLFNNKFQAVFPDSPSIQEIPKELLNPNSIKKSIPYKYRKELNTKQLNKIIADIIEKMRNSQPLKYTDEKNQVSYTLQELPSGLEHKNYMWSGAKNMLDNLSKEPLQIDNRTLVDFTSSLDKYNDTYIAIYTSTYILDGQKVYSTTKHIYYKDRIYKWTMSYIDQSKKDIFDKYQHNVKILK
ncbi:MAG: hypothetical protein CL624_04525 [Arcobacter sp.]|nr:hypothetical protein [Arcobacter sp.]|tara:strand:- start:14807 stop:16366 length:1560 start_codon:yes stop_codon:yes gene_type:complete